MRELMAWMHDADGEGPGGEELDPLLSLAAHAETQATPMPVSSRKARPYRLCSESYCV